MESPSYSHFAKCETQNVKLRSCEQANKHISDIITLNFTIPNLSQN